MPEFKKLNSSRTERVTLDQYLIDWDRAVSKPQKAVKDFLYPYWKHHRGVCEEFRIPGSKLRIDIINFQKNPPIAIEVSPVATHRQYNAHFHRKSRLNFLATVNRDLDKHKWCDANDITFVEVYDDDIDNLSPQWFLERYNVTL